MKVKIHLWFQSLHHGWMMRLWLKNMTCQETSTRLTFIAEVVEEEEIMKEVMVGTKKAAAVHNASLRQQLSFQFSSLFISASLDNTERLFSTIRKSLEENIHHAAAGPLALAFRQLAVLTDAHG